MSEQVHSANKNQINRSHYIRSSQRGEKNVLLLPCATWRWLFGGCRGSGPLCTHQSDSLWQPPDFSVNCFIMSAKWKQAVSPNRLCWFYSSWQCAAVCRLQRHIPLWLWSLRDIRWQWMEHQSIQGWVKSKKKRKSSELWQILNNCKRREKVNLPLIKFCYDSTFLLGEISSYGLKGYWSLKSLPGSSPKSQSGLWLMHVVVFRARLFYLSEKDKHIDRIQEMTSAFTM